MFSSCRASPRPSFGPPVGALQGFLVLFLSKCLLPCSRRQEKLWGFHPFTLFLIERGISSLGADVHVHRSPVAEEWPGDQSTREQRIETRQQ